MLKQLFKSYLSKRFEGVLFGVAQCPVLESHSPELRHSGQNLSQLMASSHRPSGHPEDNKEDCYAIGGEWLVLLTKKFFNYYWLNWNCSQIWKQASEQWPF